MYLSIGASNVLHGTVFKPVNQLGVVNRGSVTADLVPGPQVEPHVSCRTIHHWYAGVAFHLITGPMLRLVLGLAATPACSHALHLSGSILRGHALFPVFTASVHMVRWWRGGSASVPSCCKVAHQKGHLQKELRW